MIKNKLSVSIVIPCLNEASSLPTILSTFRKLKTDTFSNRDVEIIVADNGSSDNSVQIATSGGVRVVHCKKPGYGAAIKCGIENAYNDVIVYADADNTYNLIEAPNLVEEIEGGADLVIGSRLKGRIESGAMPFLHRYLGTPVLNLFINALYARKWCKISDCNSGFRAFRRTLFPLWKIQSDGMEFASELLVKALVSKSWIKEVPISLRKQASDRVPHLKTWRDGMRHLLQILSEAPIFFHLVGLGIFIPSWIFIVTSLIVKEPISIGFASIFAIHTMMIGYLGSFFGLVVWGIGLLLTVRKHTNVKIYRFVTGLSEDKVFWFSISFGILSVAMLGLLLLKWARYNFMFLSLQEETLVLIAFISNGMLVVSQLITAHLIKRA